MDFKDHFDESEKRISDKKMSCEKFLFYSFEQRYMSKYKMLMDKIYKKSNFNVENQRVLAFTGYEKFYSDEGKAKRIEEWEDDLSDMPYKESSYQRDLRKIVFSYYKYSHSPESIEIKDLIAFIIYTLVRVLVSRHNMEDRKNVYKNWLHLKKFVMNQNNQDLKEHYNKITKEYCKYTLMNDWFDVKSEKITLENKPKFSF